MAPQHKSTAGKQQQRTSGLMGSPTDPSTCRLDRSCCFTQLSPERMSDRMAVGAV